MRKIGLLIGIAVLMVTSSAKAVAVNWGTSGNSFGGTYGNDVVVLFRTTTSSSAPTLGISGGALTVTGGFTLMGAISLAGDGSFNSGSAVAINQNEVANWSASNHMTPYNSGSFGSGAFLGLGAYPTTIASTGSGAPGKMDYYMVVFNSSVVASATGYQIVSVPTAGPTLAGNSWNLTTDPTLLTGSWTPIPEPCSMALFGIGAAAIGLRRRFAKKS